MVNTSDFIKRLEHLLQYYGLSASSFADKINVQRSSISHLLSGRNKPSLDFVLKVVNVFPDVNLYWLLNGKGSFPSDAEKATTNTTSPPIPKAALEESPVKTLPKSKKTIEKIIIFYSDGSFEAYNN
ncbi:helix-turn-helix domain-containing protein [Zobellia barbeyronii]|uniref:Helix-turn-helix transcriptional regulator n=1 Tax=Zobellia barbeyronii TaxID=2748009 RepID=A0ABS5WHX3_9FLAO|nr:helix-turn-helix transcriptional regulator [Zobellia barbeyronii]MBT2163009.1 helix-turn-helix transcriptional regulator [Zobellia barbeyronii]